MSCTYLGGWFCWVGFARNSAVLVENDFVFRPKFRKSVVSIKFPPVILEPEMDAPILWAPGIFGFFLLENPHAHKIPPFRGGCLGFFFRRGGGWKCQFYFYGRGDFSEYWCTCFMRLPVYPPNPSGILNKRSKPPPPSWRLGLPLSPPPTK